MWSKIEEITTGNSKEIYLQLLDSLNYTAPHEFISKAYTLYRENYKNNPSINGRIFEYLICETLAQEGIVPFYYQARFAQVPNADFDVVLYNQVNPVVLTMKVSLRERYKQADLEGMALRQVYRRAQNYLITLSENEAIGVLDKIKKGDISGLDECLLAHQPEYSKLIEKLAQETFLSAEPIVPLTGKEFQGYVSGH